MITHVRKNAQRTTYTKPSHIECALISSVETTNGCLFSKDHAASLKLKSSPEYKVLEYLYQNEKECRFYLLGGL